MLNSRGSAPVAVRGSFLFSKGSLLVLIVLVLLGMATPTDGANYYNKYYGDDANADANSNSNSNNEFGDDFVDLSSQDFDKVAIMPISCIN
jgi:hypothetical protein